MSNSSPLAKTKALDVHSARLQFYNWSLCVATLLNALGSTMLSNFADAWFGRSFDHSFWSRVMECSIVALALYNRSRSNKALAGWAKSHYDLLIRLGVMDLLGRYCLYILLIENAVPANSAMSPLGIFHWLINFGLAPFILWRLIQSQQLLRKQQTISFFGIDLGIAAPRIFDRAAQKKRVRKSIAKN